MIMKHILYTLIIALISIFEVSAQGSTYMIPDIGGANMNTYIEIIAPISENGKFGTDGFYLNNPGDVLRVEPDNPADKDKITVGPVVVSWDGRLISTQVFVHPWVKPNSTDWASLDPQFVIKLRVVYNSSAKVSGLKFYILQPTMLGDVSSNPERILGEGTLGKRSPRGAMLFGGKVKLANSVYTISKNDCDPVEAGNQAYLPLFILSKGIIQGGFSTKIDANGSAPANNAGGAGGPGGGGGGGRFSDYTDDKGDDGGPGFVSGGKGGRNNSGIPFVSNTRKNYGTSTNINGMSFNGVQPPMDAAYESSGGATGHPFGQSGDPCGAGTSCNPLGKSGGGSGNQQTRPGGGGGYGTDGNGVIIPSLGTSGGRAHGNVMVVPVAGGSGGASGNPQGAGTTSGSGGGGGGAVVIFADSLENIAILANGGMAGDNDGGASTADGGGGSGGMTALYAKVAIHECDFEINGGAGASPTNISGGQGRSRWDALSLANNQNGADYRGPSTDSTKFIKASGFNLRVTKSNVNDASLYVKPLNGNWYKYSDIPLNTAFYSQPMNLTGDTVFFLAMVQTHTPKAGVFDAVPGAVLSQAGANIFQLEKAPDVSCNEKYIDTVLGCPGEVLFTKAVKIWNKGNANLVLGLDKSGFVNSKYILMAPKTEVTVKPGDTVWYDVKLPISYGLGGLIRDSLLVFHNDADTINPLKIYFDVKINLVKIKNVRIENINNFLDTLFLPSVCVGETSSAKFSVLNQSDVPVSLKPFFTNLSAFITQSDGKTFIGKGDSSAATVSFSGMLLPGRYSTKIVTSINECSGIKDSLIAVIDVFESVLNADSYTDFAETKIGSKTSKTITVRNTGNASVYLDASSFTGLGANFQFITTNPLLPIELLKGDVISINIDFAPTEEGDPLRDTLFVNTLKFGNACPASLNISLAGRGTAAALKYTNILDFDTLDACTGALRDVWVYNPSSSTASVNIISKAQKIGIDTSLFKIIEQPNIPLTLAPGDSAYYRVWFNSSASKKYDNLYVLVLSDALTGDSLFIPVKAVVVKPEIAHTPNILKYDNISAGFDTTITVKYLNKGDGKAYINNVIVTHSFNGTATVSPKSLILAPNDTVEFKIQINIKEIGNVSAFLELLFDTNKGCLISDKSKIDFTSVPAIIDTTDKLFYGTLSACKDSIMTAMIENIGAAPVIVLSAEIKGVDSGLFSFNKNLAVMPDTLHFGEKFETEVKFYPASSANGVKRAEVVLYCYINGEFKYVNIELEGNKESAFLAIPSPLVFDPQPNNTSTSKLLIVSNTGGINLTIIDTKAPISADFSISKVLVNRVLMPGEKDTINVAFSPVLPGKYSDTLFFTIEYDGCQETIPVVISGEAFNPRSLVIATPAMKADPRDNSLDIPVYVFTSPADTLNNFDFDFSFTWNRSLYKLETADAAVLKSQEYFEEDGVFYTKANFNIYSLSLKDSLLPAFTLKGMPLLGDSQDMYFSVEDTVNIKDLSRISQVIFRIDTIRYTICKEGGDRLLSRGTAAKLIIKPNPASNSAVLEAALLEAGQHTISIYDYLGRQVMNTISFMGDGTPGAVYIANLDLTVLDAGVYSVVMITPSGVIKSKMNIIK